MLKRRKNYTHESLPVLLISPWLEKTSQFIYLFLNRKSLYFTYYLEGAKRTWTAFYFAKAGRTTSTVKGGRSDGRGLTVDGGADGGLAKAARPAQHSQCELQNVNYYWVCWFWFWFLSRFLFYFEAALDFGEKAGSVFCEGEDFVWFFVKQKKGRN